MIHGIEQLFYGCNNFNINLIIICMNDNLLLSITFKLVYQHEKLFFLVDDYYFASALIFRSFPISVWIPHSVFAVPSLLTKFWKRPDLSPPYVNHI